MMNESNLSIYNEQKAQYFILEIKIRIDSEIGASFPQQRILNVFKTNMGLHNPNRFNGYFQTQTHICSKDC